MALNTDDATSTTVPCQLNCMTLAPPQTIRDESCSNEYALAEACMTKKGPRLCIKKHAAQGVARTNVGPSRLRGFPTSIPACITTQAAPAAKVCCGGAAGSGHRPASHTARATVAPLAASYANKSEREQQWQQKQKSERPSACGRPSSQQHEWRKAAHAVSAQTRITAETQTQSPYARPFSPVPLLRPFSAGFIPGKVAMPGCVAATGRAVVLSASPLPAEPTLPV